MKVYEGVEVYFQEF